MLVSKWGNSLAVRLPADVVELLGLKEGDDINLQADPENTLSLAVIKKLKRSDALRELKKFEGTMPPGFKFNRDEANER